MTYALLVVFLAGVSESIGQSVVLFANRVSLARFALSILMNALVIAAGFASLVLCTWASLWISGAHVLGLAQLVVAVGLSYAPLMLGFLSAVPYAGNAIMWVLRIAQFVAMVTGIAAAGHLSLWVAAANAAIGWAVKLGLRQAFSKPFAALIGALSDAAAGKKLVDENAAVVAVARELGADPVTRRPSNATAAAARHHGVSILGGIVFTFVAVVAIVFALTPLRVAIATTFGRLLVVRVGFDLLWIAIVAIVIAAFLAPLETLGWWAGWYGDGVDADHPAAQPPADDATPSGKVTRYIVYLDGISQSSAQYTPDVETFLDALQNELPAGTLLIRGIMAYSVLNRPLDDDPMYARFWSWVEVLRGRAKTAILGMFINIRNVMIVAVSADGRYGPLYNLGIAQVVYNALLQRGYQPQSGVPITMIGYSGGGQMCAETGPLLKGALNAPLDIISLAGVMTGTCKFQKVDCVNHMFGSKDVIEPLGPIMFASRWPIMAHSNWNRALRRKKITVAHLGPVGHQVPGGLLDPDFTLPGGTSALRQTLDHIHAILQAHAPA